MPTGVPTLGVMTIEGAECRVIGCGGALVHPLREGTQPGLCEACWQRWRTTAGDKSVTVSPRFPGLGVVACQACGQPVVEHRIGPCPALRSS